MSAMITKTSASARPDQTENQAQTTTLKPIRRFTQALFNQRGFTLIEILIVVAIISMVMAMGLPALQRVTYQRVASTTRKFVGLTRTVRNDAVLLNKVHRLVINLDKNQWWVESQKQFELLASVDPDAPKPKQKIGDKDKEPPSNFTIADKYSKTPTDLPGGVAFGGVLKEGEPFYQKGVAYIHFFPNGYNDQAILYVRKDGAEQDSYSVVIKPTGGKVDIEGGHVGKF